VSLTDNNVLRHTLYAVRALSSTNYSYSLREYEVTKDRGREMIGGRRCVVSSLFISNLVSTGW